MRDRLAQYGETHTDRVNEICHFVGIPLIIAGAASLMGAVGLSSGGRVTLAELVVALLALFYLIEARLLGLVTALAIIGIVAIGRQLPAIGGLGLFLIGWGFQLVGHSVFEKRSPAFFKNLLHLLVGPAWLVRRAWDKAFPLAPGAGTRS